MSHFEMRSPPLMNKTDLILIAVIVTCLILLWRGW